MHARRDGRALRDELLEHGFWMLNERGYHGTGIKAVLDRVSVPKGSFYNYFDSKQHFCAEVIGRFAQECNERMDDCFDPSRGNALVGLGCFIDIEIDRHASENLLGCLVGNLGAELGDELEACREAMEAAYAGWGERFARVLARGQEDGSVRADIPADQLGRLVFDAYEGALLRMRVSGDIEPLREFRTLMLERLLPA